MSVRSLRIATRKSALALWQAEHVATRLRQAHPGLEVTLVPLSTRGDEVLDQPLATIGGKGLFLKELEVAMLDNRADIAVHSLKDVPVELEASFELGAVLERADAADAFVSPRYARMSELPSGACVGTSSLRRQAQVRALRPDLEIADLRGNVNTRLAKLERGDYDAIVLACAGLERLDLGRHIRSRLAAPTWLPAPGQAAIVVEMRRGDEDVAQCLKPLDHADTRLTVRAERAMNRTLGGSCTVPVGAWCERDGDLLDLRGLVGDVASGRVLRAHASSPVEEPESLGREVARLLLDQGAQAFLDPHQTA
ncbi:MAG TPA: hydroxymethylbilane synthase [Oleiagrimonas sp.]|nr:hydroxymethylbilane synthase [Oleiagrimonas sp.]